MSAKEIRQLLNLVESADDPDPVRAPEPDWVGMGQEFARESNRASLRWELKRVGAKNWQAQRAYQAYHVERAKLMRGS